MVRRALTILFILLLVSVIGGFVARRYLTSKGVADKVVAKLQSVYKGDIKLGGVDVGLGSTSLTKLQLFEADSNEKTPWLEIEDLHTDFSLLDYFQGNSLPGKVKVSGAKVLLRFSRDGMLLTALPEPLSRSSWEDAEEPGCFDAVPIIEVDNSVLTIRTEAAEDLVFHNISCTLDKNTNQITLSGAAENRSWGKWALAGLLQKQSANINLEFSSQKSVHVTQAMLQQLPFIPEAYWREVRVDYLDTPILIHLDYDLKQAEAHCRAELNLVQADFSVNALQMQVARARGKIIFDDNHMHLRDLQGAAFDGTVRLAADVTFHADAICVTSRIEANRCQVSRLPSTWGLPAELSGQLTGIASLKVEITPADLSAPAAAGMAGLMCTPPGPLELTALVVAVPCEKTIHTEGSGKGQIIDAVAGPLRANSIQLELHAVPGGFRFGSGEK